MVEMKVPRGVSKDEVLDQIRAGVHDAMRELISIGTTNSSAAFFAAVRDGVREAVRATVTAGHLRPVSDSPTASIVEGETPEP
jgi:hypothetical protein